jgi:hypothetical protein
MSGLVVVPVRLRAARTFVEQHHRHHGAPVGGLFAVGAAADGVLVGVAIVGRPVARMFDNGQTVEVVRCCTDGTRNACSVLYGAAWRAAKAMGYTRLVTYTQAGEPGTSLLAAGWRVVAQRRPHAGWDREARPRKPRTPSARTLWEASA